MIILEIFYLKKYCLIGKVAKMLEQESLPKQGFGVMSFHICVGITIGLIVGVRVIV